MEFITKDVYNDKGVLVVKKGAPVDDILLIRLKAHGVKQLTIDEINTASIADPITEILDTLEIKSDLISMFDDLPPTIYNRAKYNSVISRLLGEWLGYTGLDLDNITSLGMFYGTGIELDLGFDTRKYEEMLKVAFMYSEMRSNKKYNVIDTLHKMNVDGLTELDTPILLLFIDKFLDLLVGTEVNLHGVMYKIIYVFPHDIAHPLIQEVGNSEIQSY